MLGALMLLTTVADPTGPIFDGSQSQLAVPLPRLEQTIVLDGRLDEPAWQQAAVLTGFSRYAPSDGAPAEDATEVLVWYSPSAIHFGIRAQARPGTVRATLADRDRIFADDHVLIFLSTFNDGRQALVFGVNPLGVQGDGALTETGSGGGGGFSGQAIGREGIDISQDFLYQSKGRLTDTGYEVEIRIPFKSIRYQPTDIQDWGISLIRKVQSSGHEDSWTPARRASPTFLGQGGQLQGLHGIDRGLVLDLAPVVTAKASGAPGMGGSWEYGGGAPKVGGNVRWGISPNWTLNGTIRPDFAEVESDASQVVYDPRLALYFPERRPFFLDGIENFSTPNRLIYTRRLSEPVTSAKLTGKTGGTQFGYIAGVDDEAISRSGHDPIVYNMLRVQEDVGRQSRIGIVATHRLEGSQSNLVAGVDGNLVLSPRYALQWQVANSWTDAGSGSRSAPLWQSTLVRSGRTWAGRFTMRGIHQDFRALSGFLSRVDIATMRVTNQLTAYGRPGSLFERGSTEVVLEANWDYQNFLQADATQDGKLHFNQNVTLRGGWGLGASVLVESFAYDPRLYDNVAVAHATGATVDTIPFNTWVPPRTARIPNLDYVVTVTSPRIGGVSMNGQLLWGRDENFAEWATADIWIVNGGIQWRPTERIRADGTYVLQSYLRRTDGSTVSVSHIPRLKVEYQATRSLFLRVVGEYRYSRQDDLRDDSRSGDPLLVRNRSTGLYERDGALGFKEESLRGDLLVSVRPNPGTVFFLGYGNTLSNPDATGGTERLGRVNDAFFLKASYLFRTR